MKQRDVVVGLAALAHSLPAAVVPPSTVENTVPARFAQAAAPWVFSLALDRAGTDALWATASIGIGVFAALMLLRVRWTPPRKRRRSRRSPIRRDRSS